MKNIVIKADNISYIYRTDNEKTQGSPAVKNLNVQIEDGEFVAVIGRNGSGKSTFARLLNALIVPSDGVLYITNMRTDSEKDIMHIRQTVGMVFQNPENQFVAASVEEDVAFGPENLGVPPVEIVERVSEALKDVGMEEYREYAPHNLSGGQKQRVAIAGILAMRPKCIVLDEATAMLDPVGRKEVLGVLKRLNEEENITIIHITHHMDEATVAHRVIVVDDGRIVMDGKPSEIFSRVEEIKALGLEVPQVTELFYELRKSGYDVPLNVLTADEAYEILKDII
ncbi:MAG TPA: energy-coupling factor transporter ATPase [Acetivibrio sp.]|jgi:energy-coupling factor transport system ATP-binding protein|nr:energy-coupling factor transporter ATPase [Clostridium sp.]HOQ37623.1 energy-coupling factor transporter ATPase [Acetivibrio sp.]HPT90745.1 energy-coupling factor transporter ATPase [Acetivibrio sp.]HQA58094.1 energy-coupling factor transporter ATPase [Acetivibrio sp.]